MTGLPSPPALLGTVAEPTRLRILNCLVAAPLFVSDLQAILGLPQPTVSRHLRILRSAGVVRDTPIGPFVLYRLRPGSDPGARMLRSILEAMTHHEGFHRERASAKGRSRQHAMMRTRNEAVMP